MLEEDFDDHAHGDDMNVDDAEDDPTWNPNDESLLSEDGDDQDWVEAESETLEDRYNKIKSEIESEPVREQGVPVVNRRLFKIRINDLLFSDHYRQLRDCVLQNRIQRMSDIEKMLQGEHVDEKAAVKDDERFRKQHRDNQLLRELCITEKYLQDHEIGNQDRVSVDPAQEKIEAVSEQDISSDAERLMEDW